MMKCYRECINTPSCLDTPYNLFKRTFFTECKVLWHEKCVPSRTDKLQEQGDVHEPPSLDVEWCGCAFCRPHADAGDVQTTRRCDDENAEEVADPPQNSQTQVILRTNNIITTGDRR